MYGLLLDSIQKFICEQYGERYWSMVRRRANLKNQWFVTHEVYSDSVMQQLVDAAAQELGQDKETVMRMFGQYFAESIGRYGYARLLRVLGRDLRDFLNGLDDLHEYLRFSYPKMRPPSFFCECETVDGLKLHYTTKRRGYLHYVIGQLKTVGRIYGKEVEVALVSEETFDSGTCHMVLDLKFDNTEFLQQKQIVVEQKQFTVNSQTFLGMFPFCLLLDQELVVQEVGLKICEVLPPVVGLSLTEAFNIRKPMLEGVTWKEICLHANCVFELESTSQVIRKGNMSITNADSLTSLGIDFQAPPPQLRLKGQMLPLTSSKLLAFLCSPVMASPEDLYESGIYVNDLSMHDSSRDIILAGSQKDPELTLALSQEKIRSAQLEESVQQMDRLLYQMIPKPIAIQLRNGETALNTCKEFSSVSILFSDIVSFTPMCSRLHPMEVVCVLNAMYVAYDHLCEVHHVYKTETIGDAYMAICGAPVYTVHHAEYITDFAIAIIKATANINDPSTDQSLKIRVGIHSGHVVAGVVGSTVLRYDVFGDTVNVAARMEATGEPMKVHVSEATAKKLMGTSFIVKERGTVNVKGKGDMKTYWVTGKQTLPDVPEEELVEEPLPETTSFHPSARVRSPMNSPPSTPSPPLLPPNSRIHPSASPHSPTNRTSPILNVTRSECSFSGMSQSSKMARSLSPKPSEWPLAERQLQKYESVALDNSVPPGGRRRKTVPALKVESEVMRLSNRRRQSAQEISQANATSVSSPAISIDAIDNKILGSENNLLQLSETTNYHHLWQQQSAGWPQGWPPGYIPSYQPLLPNQISGPPYATPTIPPSAGSLTVAQPPTDVTRMFQPYSFPPPGNTVKTSATNDSNASPTANGDIGNENGGIGNENGGIGNENGGIGNENGGIGNENGGIGNENGGIEMKFPSPIHNGTGAESVAGMQDLPTSGVTLALLHNFAARAEENACRARQLADHTAHLLRHLEGAHSNGKLMAQDTSVDPEVNKVSELLPASCPLHVSQKQELTVAKNLFRSSEETSDDTIRTETSIMGDGEAASCIIL